MISSQDIYEVRQRKDKRGVNLISDALPFAQLWHYEAGMTLLDYAEFFSRLA